MTHLKCSRCHNTKPVSEFKPHTGRTDRFYKKCNACLASPLSKNPTHRKSMKQKWIRENKEHVVYTEENRRMLKTYGISLKDYEKMALEQGNKCAICRRPPTELRKLHVDHCHMTNLVRKLLCTKCNALIGMADEDLSILTSAIEYLKTENC